MIEQGFKVQHLGVDSFWKLDIDSERENVYRRVVAVYVQFDESTRELHTYVNVIPVKSDGTQVGTLESFEIHEFWSHLFKV